MIIKFETNINELADPERIPYVETAVRSRIWRALPALLAGVHVVGVTGVVTVAFMDEIIAAEIETAVAQALYVAAGDVEIGAGDS